MRFERLQDWLDWQETLHPSTIDLGLQRVTQCLAPLGLADGLCCPVITVAGTNGKGSTVAFVAAIARAHGLRVGCYTSPHLFHYQERITFDGQPVEASELCRSFERIDQARGDIPLTYFEFGTLAALDLFQRASLDLVVLEVGLGGRLDATNVVAADVAILTSVAIDHQQWLGDDREAIGREKAGIFRQGRAAICAEAEAPASVGQVAREVQADLLLAGRDYHYRIGPGSWQLQFGERQWSNLPAPGLAGDCQYGNAAAALLALHQLGRQRPGWALRHDRLAEALRTVRLPGRFQRVREQPAIWVDVAHNPQAATALAAMLRQQGSGGRRLAVFAALADKEVESIVDILSAEIDWLWLAGLPGVPRGLSAAALMKRVQAKSPGVKLLGAETVETACRQALAEMRGNDSLIVFGSFHTVAQASALLVGNGSGTLRPT